MAGETAEATGDTTAGETPTPSNGVKWPTAEDLASWNETPSEAEGSDTPAGDPAVEEETVEAQGDEPEVEETPAEATQKRAPVPYARLEQTVRQKQEALQQLAQANAKNELLQMQLQQILDYVKQSQVRGQPQVEAEVEEFVDPDRAEIEALKKQLAEVTSWKQEQAVAATAQQFENEYNQSVALYPLAAKATPLVFALLENNKQLSVSDAVKEVHNHLAGVLPKTQAPPQAKPVQRNPAAKPPPPKGPTSNASALSAQPRYKTLEEAQKAFLSQQ